MSLPLHVAIIMDGNGRWAQEKGLKRSAGHLAGSETVRTTIQECVKLGIRYLTLYAFSTENWKRPKEEVNYLFSLFCDFVQKELPLLVKEGVRLTMIGQKSDLPLATRTALKYAMQKTAKGKNMELILALNYSGTDEIVHATRESVLALFDTPKTLEKIRQHSTNDKDLKKYLGKLFSEKNYGIENIQNQVYNPNAPAPDLIIRTGGELRLSNFYLLQAAYAEFYFTDVYWPDFQVKDFHDALDAYKKRKRRYGATEVS